MTAKKRLLKLAGMTANIAGQAAKTAIRHATGSEEQKAEARSEMLTQVGVQIANTLGEMKGAAMKVGQIASQYKDIFPPEIAQALEKLQNDAPPMPFDVIEQQVERELGQPLATLYAEFEPEPFAAASIGQVHRARLPDGQAVVVKVQYPDIDAHIDSDLKQVRLALKLTGVLKIDKALQDQIFAELRDSLVDELDYQKEAQNLAIFGEFHRDDAGIVIPRVFASHSSRRVLTLSEERGEPLSVAATWDNDIKQQIATRLFHFSAGQLFKLYRLHCDPHPGNFAFRSDGTVVAYDFGGIKTYSHAEVRQFYQIACDALRGDASAIDADLVTLGLKKTPEPLPEPFYHNWLNLVLAPYGFTDLHNPPYDLAQHAPFDFEHSQVHHQIVEQAKQSLKYWQQFQPSPLTLMLERTLSGQYWNLVNLGVKIDLAPLVDEYIDLEQLNT